MGKYVGL